MKTQRVTSPARHVWKVALKGNRVMLANMGCLTLPLTDDKQKAEEVVHRNPTAR